MHGHPRSRARGRRARRPTRARCSCRASGRELHAVDRRRRRAAPARRSATSSPTSSTATSTSPTSASSTAASARSAATTARKRATSCRSEEVVRRASEAWDLGATEVCIQAGLPPKLDGCYYVDLVRALKTRCPSCTSTRFSPEEVLYGADPRGRARIEDYLDALQGGRLGTLPGHLGRDPRRRGARHDLARPHQHRAVDRGHHDRARARHPHDLDDHVRPHRDLRGTGRGTWRCSRDIQKSTGGFTEFVPLSFIHKKRRCTTRSSCPACAPARPAPKS